MAGGQSASGRGVQAIPSPESPDAPAGESFDLAARELLDELALLQCDAQRTRALAEEPLLTGDPRHDAYLAAL